MEETLTKIVQMYAEEKETSEILSAANLTRKSLKLYTELITSIKRYMETFEINCINLSSSELHLPKPTLELILSCPYHKLKVKNEVRGTEKREKIAEAYQQGCRTVKAIQNATGLSRTLVRYYESVLDIELEKERRGRKINTEKKEKVAQAYQQGCRTVKAIQNATGSSRDSVRYYTKVLDINLEKEKMGRKKGAKKETKRIPERDAGIEEGLILEEIRELDGVTREAIRLYIKRTGQYEKWQTARKKRLEALATPIREEREKKKVLSDIISSVIQYKAVHSEEPWAAQKALEYISNHNKTQLSFEKLYGFFKRYKQAMDNGEKISINRLTEETGFNYAVQISDILKDSGLKTLCNQHRTKGFVAKMLRRGQIKKIAQLPAPYTDIGYFLKINASTICSNIKRERYKKNISRFLYNMPLSKVTYKLASQVYEAQDSGFNQDETIELLGKPKEAIDWCLKNRAKIEPKIIRIIKTLYPSSKKINMPYLT